MTKTINHIDSIRAAALDIIDIYALDSNSPRDIINDAVIDYCAPLDALPVTRIRIRVRIEQLIRATPFSTDDPYN